MSMTDEELLLLQQQEQEQRQQQQQAAPPQHLLGAVSDARDNVVNSFDAQRSAIRKAVDDQRRAALAPVQAQRAKRRGAMTPDQTVELVLLLRQLVAEEVRRELDRRGAQFAIY